MTRRSRFAALVAVVALAAAGCSSNDAKESDVVSAMEDAGLTTEQSECIGERMQAEFGDNQDLYNEIASATDIDDLPAGDASAYPDGTEPVIEGILDECLAGTGDTTEADSDTTDTTVAGDGTTTTTAG